MSDINVGAKITQFRMLKQMTIKELAQKAKITSSMLSQVERNRVNPSLQTLRDIASALDTPLFYFFKDDPPAEGIVVRRERRKTLGYPDEKDVLYQLLTPDTNSNIEFCFMELPPMCDLRSRPSRHMGEEVACALDAVDIWIDGTQYQLRAEDSIQIPAGAEHAWVNISNRPARVIFALSPPSF